MPLQSRTFGRRSASALDVVERAAQIRLQDDADVLVAGLAQLAIEAQRVVGRRRVLHVDAHEAVIFRGLSHDVLEVRAARVVGEPEAEPGELDADVRVEVLALDLVERVAVRLRDGARLVRRA